jgi:hypothetical protein
MATLQDLMNMDLEKEGVSKIIAEYVWYVFNLMPWKPNSFLMPVPALFY